MHPDELKNFSSPIRVKAHGYVRDFSKIATDWGNDGEDTGVLGIQKAEDEWCNGLVVQGLSQHDFDKYVERETGYDFDSHKNHDTEYDIKQIDADCLEPYNKNREIPDEVFTAIMQHRLSEPNPHEEYRELCCNAAAQYGDEFRKDFIQTTYELY